MIKTNIYEKTWSNYVSVLSEIPIIFHNVQYMFDLQWLPVEELHDQLREHRTLGRFTWHTGAKAAKGSTNRRTSWDYQLRVHQLTEEE